VDEAKVTFSSNLPPLPLHHVRLPEPLHTQQLSYSHCVGRTLVSQGCKDKSELPTREITTQNREEEDWVLPDAGHTLLKHPLVRLSCTPETARLQLILGL